MKQLEMNRIEINRRELGCGENLSAGVSQVYSVLFISFFP